MADNISFKVNNSLDELSKGFSLPSAMILPKPAKKPDTKAIDTFTTKTPQEKNPPQDTTLTPDNNVNPKKKPLGKIVFYSMLAVAGAVLLLTKGLSGATAGKIRAVVDRWENKFIRNASKNKVTDALDKTIVRTSQKVKRIFSLTEAIPNFTTAGKDTLIHKITSWDFLNIKNKYINLQPVHKFLNKWLPIQRVCNFITNNILKITYSAVDSKYKAVNSAVEKLEARYCKIFNKYAKTHPDKAQKAYELLDKVRACLHGSFSKAERDKRLMTIHSDLASLSDNVSSRLSAPFKNHEHKGFINKIKAFWGKFRKNYSTYVTPKMSEPVQLKHKKVIETAKKAISNEISDVSAKLQNSANDMKHLFSEHDISSRLAFGDLLEKMESYKWLSGSKEAASRQKLQQEILSNLSQIKDKVANFIYTDKKGNIAKYSKEEIGKITKLISNMEETLITSSEKGMLQELLSLVKPVFSESEYKSVKAGTRYVNNLFNDAVDIEGNNMFNKIAESKVGSIVTDMFGLAALGYTGIRVTSKGKDKDEKVGAALKVGVPLLGTIGTYFYSAAKAFSGITNLAFSLGTGFVLNRIGNSIYNYYQKRFVQNKTVKEIVQDTYDDAIKT